MNNSSMIIPIFVDETSVKRVGIDMFKGDGIYELSTKTASIDKHDC